jgi:predicted AlkP superfamily phosphohydrolase/phosphomutase
VPPKILIIGLDGADPKLVESWTAAGHLPNIAALLNRGVYSRLRSSIHPITPSAWSTFLTGKNAGKHGIYNFVSLRGDGYGTQYTNGGFLAGSTFLQQCSEAGMRVGAFEIPWTYPPVALNGYTVTGLDAPSLDRSLANPPEIFDEIVREVGPYSLRSVWREGDERVYDLKGHLGEFDKRIAAVNYLFRQHPTDISMVVFQATDTIQHLFFRDRQITTKEGEQVEDVILHTYKYVDRYVGQLLDQHVDDQTTVVLLSDHGGQPCERFFNLKRWMIEAGYTQIAAGRQAARRFRGSLRRTLKSMVPAAVRQKLLARRGINWTMPEAEADWEQTRAFCWGSYGNIQINLQGRQANGIVPPDQVEQLCQQIATELLEIVDPTTEQRPVAQVLTGAELYHGPLTAEAPDLLVVASDGYEVRSGMEPEQPLSVDPMDSSQTGNPPFGGTHAYHGILGLAGPHITAGASVDDPWLADLAPTLLYLAGLPVPEDMDGRVLEEVLDSQLLAKRPLQQVTDQQADVQERQTQPYSEEQAAEIEKRLQDLGYF